MDITINGIEHTVLYIDEDRCDNAAILIPKRTRGEMPSFMAVKNIKQTGRDYKWDDVFYTEDLGNACRKCDFWVRATTQK